MARARGAAPSPEASEAAAAGAGLPAVPPAQPEPGRRQNGPAAGLQTPGEPRAGEGKAPAGPRTAAQRRRCQDEARSEPQSGENGRSQIG